MVLDSWGARSCDRLASLRRTCMHRYIYITHVAANVERHNGMGWDGITVRACIQLRSYRCRMLIPRMQTRTLGYVPTNRLTERRLHRKRTAQDATGIGVGLLICLSRAAALETSAASGLAQFASIGIPKSRLRTAQVAASSEQSFRNVWPTDSFQRCSMRS